MLVAVHAHANYTRQHTQKSLIFLGASVIASLVSSFRLSQMYLPYNLDLNEFYRHTLIV